MKGFMCDKMTLYHYINFSSRFANLKISFILTNYSRRLGRIKICFLVLLSNKFNDHFNSLIVYFTDQKLYK